MYVDLELPVLTNDLNGYCLNQDPGEAGPLLLNGQLVNNKGEGVAAAAQTVSITSGFDESGRTFTVDYLNADGDRVTGTITGPNAGVATSTFYASKVFEISVDAATAGSVFAGTGAAGGMITPTIVVNRDQTPFNASVFFDLQTGTMTVSGQYSADDVRRTDWETSYTEDATWRDIVGLADVTADDVSNISYPVMAVRFIQTTGSTTGSGRVQYIQGTSK